MGLGFRVEGLRAFRETLGGVLQPELRSLQALAPPPPLNPKPKP